MRCKGTHFTRQKQRWLCLICVFNNFQIYIATAICLSLIFLHKISFGQAVSSLVKLRFPALLLLSPCIIFAAYNLSVMKRFFKDNLGILLVCTGVLTIFILYVLGRTGSNVVNILASVLILTGIVLYVRRMKKSGGYQSCVRRAVDYEYGGGRMPVCSGVPVEMCVRWNRRAVHPSVCHR